MKKLYVIFIVVAIIMSLVACIAKTYNEGTGVTELNTYTKSIEENEITDNTYQEPSAYGYSNTYKVPTY